MYIYLDESFQLQPGAENQFLTIAGFETDDPNRIAKLFNRVKKHTLPRSMTTSEIKSSNSISDRAMKPRLFHLLARETIGIYAITQLKHQLPPSYFTENGLLYDKLYLDLLTILLVREWDYRDEQIVITTMDSFRPKTIPKGVIIEHIKSALRERYPDKFFDVRFGGSELLNIQLADYICGAVYQLMQNNQQWFDLMKPKLKKIVANPLSS